ncbi:hypothetical protein FKM82_009272 [Ascaphus truei]
MLVILSYHFNGSSLSPPPPPPPQVLQLLFCFLFFPSVSYNGSFFQLLMQSTSLISTFFITLVTAAGVGGSLLSRCSTGPSSSKELRHRRV